MQITEHELARALAGHHPGRAQLPAREAADLFRMIGAQRAEDTVSRTGTAAPPETRIWFLDVTYPPGSQAPGWEPSWWRGQARLRWRPLRRPAGFRWPRRRLFLSRSGAWSHAAYLTWCGAAVRVRRSDPVTWPGEAGELVILYAPDQEAAS